MPSKSMSTGEHDFTVMPAGQTIEMTISYRSGNIHTNSYAFMRGDGSGRAVLTRSQALELASLLERAAQQIPDPVGAS